MSLVKGVELLTDTDRLEFLITQRARVIDYPGRDAAGNLDGSTHYRLEYYDWSGDGHSLTPRGIIDEHIRQGGPRRRPEKEQGPANDAPVL